MYDMRNFLKQKENGETLAYELRKIYQNMERNSVDFRIILEHKKIMEKMDLKYKLHINPTGKNIFIKMDQIIKGNFKYLMDFKEPLILNKKVISLDFTQKEIDRLSVKSTQKKTKTSTKKEASTPSPKPLISTESKKTPKPIFKQESSILESDFYGSLFKDEQNVSCENFIPLFQNFCNATSIFDQQDTPNMSKSTEFDSFISENFPIQNLFENF